MEKFEIAVPCLFGLESFVSKELKRLGIKEISAEDGRVCFWGGYDDVIRTNLWLRTGERVLIKIAEFNAVTFEELYEGTKAAAWSRFLPKNAVFPVSGYSLKSTLASVRDCQAIIKKAAADSLSASYGISWLPEDGAMYKLRFSILKDRVSIMLDTSGEGLHKRGYRRHSNAAPLKETIAAAMVMMSFWHFEEELADPFCGSGTIPIEAALFKRNIAPGLLRSFAFEEFEGIKKERVAEIREEASSCARNTPLSILASDIDPSCAELTAENARIAGVGDAVKPFCADAVNFSRDNPCGSIICNPPYGERLSALKECEELYAKLGSVFSKLDRWSYYILAADEAFETHFGKRADKRRKVYNGMIKCNVFQYFGNRPGR